ncbi:hypothetical protein [Streptomyces atriruber]|uniref:hypothetical protein n=1 Tax=Streptomyces atriruber TaxID=545121 RepID=UPI0006E41184|nr:hypothetical protein [Streptomyces atriruber]
MTQPDPSDRRIRDSLTQAGERVDARLVEFIRWYQLRPRRAPGEDAADQDGEPDSRKWGAVGRATIVLGLAQAGLPAVAIMGLYTALANVEETQATMLKSLDKKASLLLDGPLRTAQLLMHEAARIGLSDPRYAATLQQAWDRFFDAYGLAGSPQSRAVVQMHLGQVSLLLGRHEDAAHWMMESYRCARQAIEVLAAGSNDGRVLRSKWGTAASVYVSPVGLAVFARKLGKIRKAQHSLEATRSYVEFVNAVAAGVNAVSTHAVAAGLTVEQLSLNEFVIREVPETPEAPST